VDAGVVPARDGLRMHALKGSEEFRTADLATTVASAMARLGVAGLPRNYEIFYEALVGGNAGLLNELSALGARPKQEDLDEIALKYFPRSNSYGLLEATREQVAGNVEDILRLMEKERLSLEKFGKILDETSAGLARRETLTRDLLNGIIGVISVATSTTSSHGRQIASSMADKSGELEEVKTKLEEYRKLAETDALTQLANRRAFDAEITRIFDSRRKLMFSALVLIDIDNFKAVNDRHGHPIGDRIIQIVAGVIRGSVRNDAFVARTGGEEFALILEGLSEDATLQLAERVRTAVMETPFINANTQTNYGPVTVSAGLCMAAEADNADDLYAKADRALYASKSNGRNRVTRHSALGAGDFTKNWLLYRRD